MRRLLLPFAALAALLPANAPTAALAGPLVADAGMARYALAADQQYLFEWLDPASAAVLADALGGENAALGHYWSTLMAGAVQMRREDAEAGETLWFNPLFDAGLAIAWEPSSTGWVAVAAVPVTGEMLRGEPFSALPVSYAGSIKDEAEARARATWAAAAAGPWVANDATSAGLVVLSRVMDGQDGLDGLRASEGYETAGMMVRELLAGTDDRALAAPLRDALALMGPDARLSLRPVAGWRRADGWTMALQSPDAPMLTWLAHFTDPAAEGQAATLAALQIANLGDVQ
jgi:hypothetical protein